MFYNFPLIQKTIKVKIYKSKVLEWLHFIYNFECRNGEKRNDE